MIARSLLIEKSLSCLHWGLAAFVPVFGVFAGGKALLQFRTAVVERHDRWNPAAVQLYLGMALALLSWLLHAVGAYVIYLQVIRTLGDG